MNIKKILSTVLVVAVVVAICVGIGMFMSGGKDKIENYVSELLSEQK